MKAIVLGIWFGVLATLAFQTFSWAGLLVGVLITIIAALVTFIAKIELWP